jgi:hypothetical protein
MNIIVKALTLISVFAGVPLNAATPDWEWVRVGGGGGSDFWGGVSVRGSDIFASFMLRGGTFGPVSPSGNAVVWGKLDGNNNIVTAKAWPVGQYGYTMKIVAGAGSDVFVAGEFGSTASIGGNSLSAAAGVGSFVAKTDGNGNVLWARSFDPRENGFYGKGLAVDPQGNLLLTTAFKRIQMDGFDIGAATGWDVAIMKLNPQGTVLWMRRISGMDYDEPQNVCSDSAGNVYVCGSYYTGPATFDNIIIPGDGSTSKEGFIAKYSANGSVQWAKRFGTAGPHDAVTDVKLNSKGNPVICGIFLTGPGSWEWFEPGSGFIAELDTDGNTLWKRNLPVNPRSLVCLSDGLLIASSFYATAVIDGKSFTSRGSSDVLVSRHDANGALLWGRSGGSSGVDYPTQIAFGSSGETYVSGMMYESATFGSVVAIAPGAGDFFLAKLTPDTAQLPMFTAQPQSITVSGGMNIDFNAAAVSDLPLTFQWWFNGAPLTGQTSQSLLLTNVRSENAGSYFVVAKNSAGETQSEIANVSYTDAGSLQLSVHPSLTIFGTPGRTYRIDYAVETRSPAVWTTITSIALPTAPYVWQDTNAAITDKRFYRVLLQP